MQRSRTSGFLMRLSRDRAGNTLAIMAAMVLPLIAFAGCAVDITRMYVVKSRLQQACDAGVLAGRRTMTDSSLSNSTLDSNASTQAQAFFKNNFTTGWFGTGTPTFTPRKTSDAQVAGTASVVVPMTLMTIFGKPSATLNVTCQANYDIADTDILFVLDTTGSMACLPSDSSSTCTNYVNAAGTTAYTRPSDSASGNDSVPGYAGTTGYYVPEKSGSRIAALRTAVLNFYDTMKANVDVSTHVRYGFVTYTSTVNAGEAIMNMSPSYMVGGAGNSTTSWTYQSRVQDGEAPSTSTTTVRVNSRSECESYASSKSYNSAGIGTSVTATYNPRAWYNLSFVPTCDVTTTTFTPRWVYKPVSLPVTGFVAGAAVRDPTKAGNVTSTWLGCVEERNTSPGVMSFSTSSLPEDLDPELLPSSVSTSWRPMWPEVTYARNNYGSTGEVTEVGDAGNHPNLGGESRSRSGFVSCGKPVRRLAEMSRDQVSTYVNASDFRAIGGTYHDTGMIWGTRMLSPKGIFAKDTQAWTGRQEPNRVIVFLTDGDMSPNTQVYGLYGMEHYDRRVTGGDFSSITTYHNARFLAECSKAKAMNIDVWTVAIGLAATSELQSCATTTAQSLSTTDGNGLATAFSTIAKQIASLRITQ